ARAATRRGDGVGRVLRRGGARPIRLHPTSPRPPRRRRSELGGRGCPAADRCQRDDGAVDRVRQRSGLHPPADGRAAARARDDARADATGHPPTIVYASSNMLRIGQILEDRALVGAVAAKMREFGERLAAPRITAYARMADGWLQMRDGHADGVVEFREGWEV